MERDQASNQHSLLTQQAVSTHLQCGVPTAALQVFGEWVVMRRAIACSTTHLALHSLRHVVCIRWAEGQRSQYVSGNIRRFTSGGAVGMLRGAHRAGNRIRSSWVCKRCSDVQQMSVNTELIDCSVRNCLNSRMLLQYFRLLCCEIYVCLGRLTAISCTVLRRRDG